MNEWSSDIENILENVRINSSILAQYHKDRYYKYKRQIKYFKIPLIVLSSITSIVSVGLNNYIEQEVISLMTCALSFAASVIASIEVYLGIQKNMEIEFISSRNFLILSYGIFKILSLKRENRNENGKKYLDEIYSEYNKLIENSELLKNKNLKDNLLTIPEPYKLLQNMEMISDVNDNISETINEKNNITLEDSDGVKNEISNIDI